MCKHAASKTFNQLKTLKTFNQLSTLKHIFHFFGIPEDIISDHGTLFR